MPLLETIVFPNIMKIVPSDNNSTLHLYLDNGTTKDATPDRDIASEWALLVDVFTLDGLTWRLESQADVSCVSQLLLGDLLLQV